jgi:predicted SAM-dependent methyltransferase/predicted 2-oxoglutarate/Fe(II)-dependent dioxygenase YbiX
MPVDPDFALPWMPSAGDLAPEWTARTLDGEAVSSESLAGRATLLCLLPEGAAFFDALERLGSIACEVRGLVATPHSLGGRRWRFPVLIDEGGAIARAFGLPASERSRPEAPRPRVALIGPDRRVLATREVSANDAGARAAKELVADPSPGVGQAPVLVIPGLLSNEHCQALVAAWRSGETVPGRVTRTDGSQLLGVVDPSYKNRRDLPLMGALRDQVWQQLQWRMSPLVRRAWHFDIRHCEYLQVGRYSAEEGGHFSAHRDDTTTPHRRFALTLNLNDGYEGGELHFPEFDATYRPRPGEAVVFSCALFHQALPVTRGDRFVLVGMFWSDAEVAPYERVQRRFDRAGAPVPPPVQRDAQLVEDAQMLREVAGDVATFGRDLDDIAFCSPKVRTRLDEVHGALSGLRDELRSLRLPFVVQQLKERELYGRPKGLKLHLGAGGHPLRGWVNIDVSGTDFRQDLRWGLPFPDGAAKYIFASHVVEHLYRYHEAPTVLGEIHRVLAPGGVFRVVVPDVEKCLRAYARGDERFFEDRKKTWPWAATCKTRLDHFLTYAGANQTLEGFTGHKYGYDFETLSLALREAGFARVKRSRYMGSEHPPLRVDDASSNASARSRGTSYSLFVEARKSL